MPQLEGVLCQLFSSGLAASTQRTYRTGSRRYVAFCSDAAINPFPSSEQSLCLFVCKLFMDKLSPQTVKCYLSAVRFSQIALGLGDPRVESMPRLEYVIKGYKKSIHKRALPRLPILPSHLLLLKGHWETLSVRRDALMLWAAACLCFFRFLRAGEMVTPSDSGYDSASHQLWGRKT